MDRYISHGTRLFEELARRLAWLKLKEEVESVYDKGCQNHPDVCFRRGLQEKLRFGNNGCKYVETIERVSRA